MRSYIALPAALVAAGLALQAPRPATAETMPERPNPASPSLERGAPRTRPTAHESAAAHIAAHRALVASVERQVRRSSWAAKTETSLAAELRNAREANAVIERVDCRSNACLVFLEWESFHLAREGWEALLNVPLSAPCDREITLEDPPRPDRPYRAQLVLTNCAPPAPFDAATGKR